MGDRLAEGAYLVLIDGGSEQLEAAHAILQAHGIAGWQLFSDASSVKY